MDWGRNITYLGSTTLKERAVQFGIKDADRLRHFCVLGKSGSGRADLIVRMALQDIGRGIGTVLIDATGKAASLLIERIDPSLKDNIIYLDPASAEYPYSWNPLDDIRSLPEDNRQQAVIDLITALYHVPRTTFVEYMADLLLKRDDATLITFHLLVTNEKSRSVFFEKDEKEKDAFEAALKADTEIAEILEEEGRYIGKDTLIRNLLGQERSKFTLQDVFDGKILIVDCSQMKIFPTRMTPIVSTFVNTLRILSEEKGSRATLYLQDSLRYLSEKEIERAFGSKNVAISVADTVVQESDRERREFAISRCGSVASFASHTADTPLIERAFYPYADADEVARLDSGEMIVALTIDSVRARPFFAKALPLPDRTNISYQDLLVACRSRYTVSRTSVDEVYKKFKGSDKDEGPRRKGPGGFQDAFRSIMANRAQNLPLGKNQPNAKPGEEKSKTPDAKNEKSSDQKPPSTSSNQKKDAPVKEVPEDVLKKLLFVTPITAALAFFFALPTYSALAASPQQFVFTTPAQTISANTVSDTMTLEAQDSTGTPTKGTTICMEITSSSSDGEFSSNGIDWGASPYRTLVLTLASNQYRRNFYFRSAVDGSFTVSLAAATRPDNETCTNWSASQSPEWTATQTITVGTVGSSLITESSTADSSSGNTNQTQSQSSSSGGVFIPDTTKIHAYAGEDRTVIVGADSAFTGEAIGGKGAPLENARYVWSFGNGDRKEGKSVLYNFAYPGTYVVVLDVSNDFYSASDRVMVRAVTSTIRVTAVTPEYIALKNSGSGEVDIGGWLLFSAGKQFQFPLHTILTGGQEVYVSNKRTGLSGNDPSSVALQYPNGIVAAAYEYPLFLSAPQTTKTTISAGAPQQKNVIGSANTSEVTQKPNQEELITAPIVALDTTHAASQSSFPLWAWVLSLVILILLSVFGVLFIKKGEYREYSVTEIKE